MTTSVPSTAFSFDVAACDAIIAEYGNDMQAWLDTIAIPDGVIGNTDMEIEFGFSALDFWNSRLAASPNDA